MSTNQNKFKNHSFFMNLALNQAYLNLGSTKENPAVGCVIAKENNLISAASTSFNGRPHAEYNAIKFSRENLNNSFLYVTLEPCSHYGKTPPCVKKIINNKIKKVFYSINDPDPRSYKKSLNQFRRNKIKSYVGLCSKQIKNFYKSYIMYKKNQLPFVTCKIAISRDFFTIDKRKKWITNYYSRSRVHLMRSYHDCLITSYRTIITDNPLLNCRIKGLEKKSPTRVILDKKLKTPLSSNVFKKNLKNKTIIFHNSNNFNKINLFKKKGLKVFKVRIDKEENLDLREVLIKCKNLGFSRIFLECGVKLASSFFKKKLVDELKIFVSNNYLKNNGTGSIKNYFNTFLRNKKSNIEKVNLFNDKLLSYKIK